MGTSDADLYRTKFRDYYITLSPTLTLVLTPILLYD
jgi:hypothetical protein